MLKSIGKQSAESVESVVDGLVDFLHLGKNHAARNVNGHVSNWASKSRTRATLPNLLSYFRVDCDVKTSTQSINGRRDILAFCWRRCCCRRELPAARYLRATTGWHRKSGTKPTLRKCLTTVSEITCERKKVKVAHTRLQSVGFRS